MKNSDKIKFGKMMALLQDIYVPGKPISSTKVQLYFDMLSEISIEELAVAIEQIIRTKKYATFPLIPEILEAIGIDKKEDDEAEILESWGRLMQDVDAQALYEGLTKADGTDTEVIIENEILKETVDVAFGSLWNYRNRNKETDAAHRRHFIDCYRGVKKRHSPRKELKSSVLTGIIEDRKQLSERK